MTVWTLVTVLATPLGPLVGGGLVTLWGWRTIFVFDLLAMGIALACIVRAVPASSAEPAGAVSGQAGSRVWGGGVAMALAVTVLTAGLIRMGEEPAVVPAGILVLAGTVLLAVIVVLDLQSGDPVVGFGLFADRRFALAALVLGLLNVVLYGLIFVLPSYLQTVLGHSAMVGSAFLLPLLLGAILAGSATEHVVRRHGAIRTCLSSVVALGAGLGAMAWGIGDNLLAGVLIGEFVVGSGAGIGQSTAMALGMDHIPSASRGRGSALLNVLRTFGSVLGVTMIGGVSGLVYLRRLPRLLPGSAVEGDLGTTVAQAFDAADRQPPVLADAIRAAAGTAYADALVWALLMGVAVSMIVGVAGLALGRGCSRGQISEEPQA
jgi:MFS family permease